MKEITMPTSKNHEDEEECKHSAKSSVEDCDTGEVVLDKGNKDDVGANNNYDALLRIPNENMVLEWGERNGLIFTPSSNDVILGRGKPFQTHPGNVRLRKIVSEHQAAYKACRREQRRVFAEKILEELLECGVRFIKRRVVNRRVFWEPVNLVVSLDKVHHLLREKRENYKKEARDHEREIPTDEAKTRSSNVGVNNVTNPADLASLAVHPLMGTSREAVFGSSLVEPAQTALIRRDLELRLGQEPLVPLETQVLPLSSVSPLTSAWHPLDILLQGGSSLGGTSLKDLDRRPRLLDRSVFSEQASLASASLLNFPCSSYYGASLQSQNRLEDALASLLSRSSLAASGTTLTHPPAIGISAAGSSSTLRQLLHASLSPNPGANLNMRLSRFTNQSSGNRPY